MANEIGFLSGIAAMIQDPTNPTSQYANAIIIGVISAVGSSYVTTIRLEEQMKASTISMQKIVEQVQNNQELANAKFERLTADIAADRLEIVRLQARTERIAK